VIGNGVPEFSCTIEGSDASNPDAGRIDVEYYCGGENISESVGRLGIPY